MALDRRAARPRLDYPPLHIVRFSGKALTEGIETHSVEGVRVHVYNPAKTVADCFKYRNKIGLEVALEAEGRLREPEREQWEKARAPLNRIRKQAARASGLDVVQYLRGKGLVVPPGLEGAPSLDYYNQQDGWAEIGQLSLHGGPRRGPGRPLHLSVASYSHGLPREFVAQDGAVRNCWL